MNRRRLFLLLTIGLIIGVIVHGALGGGPPGHWGR